MTEPFCNRAAGRRTQPYTTLGLDPQHQQGWDWVKAWRNVRRPRLPGNRPPAPLLTVWPARRWPAGGFWTPF